MPTTPLQVATSLATPLVLPLPWLKLVPESPDDDDEDDEEPPRDPSADPPPAWPRFGSDATVALADPLGAAVVFVPLPS